MESVDEWDSTSDERSERDIRDRYPTETRGDAGGQWDGYDREDRPDYRGSQWQTGGCADTTNDQGGYYPDGYQQPSQNHPYGPSAYGSRSIEEQYMSPPQPTYQPYPERGYQEEYQGPPPMRSSSDKGGGYAGAAALGAGAAVAVVGGAAIAANSADDDGCCGDGDGGCCGEGDGCCGEGDGGCCGEGDGCCEGDSGCCGEGDECCGEDSGCCGEGDGGCCGDDDDDCCGCVVM